MSGPGSSEAAAATRKICWRISREEGILDQPMSETKMSCLTWSAHGQESIDVGQAAGWWGGGRRSWRVLRRSRLAGAHVHAALLCSSTATEVTSRFWSVVMSDTGPASTTFSTQLVCQSFRCGLADDDAGVGICGMSTGRLRHPQQYCVVGQGK